MKTYTKIHKNEKAADTHAKKIKARGGYVIKTKELGKFKLIYGFEGEIDPDVIAEHEDSKVNWDLIKKSKKKKFKKGDIVAHTKFKTIGIVRLEDERGETKTDADGNVETRLLEYYNPEKHTKKKGYTIAPSTKKDPAFQEIYLPF